MNNHKLFLKQESLVEKLYYEFMKSKGYSVHLNQEDDISCLGYGGIAFSEDAFAPIFNLHNWPDPKSFNIFVEDRNGSSILNGETVAVYSISVNSDISFEDLQNKFEKLLNDVYDKYSVYSRENRLDFVYNNLQQDRKEYIDVKQDTNKSFNSNSMNIEFLKDKVNDMLKTSDFRKEDPYIQLQYILLDKAGYVRDVVCYGRNTLISVNPNTMEQKEVLDDYNVDDSIFRNLENDMTIGYMNDQNHYDIWCSINDWFPYDINYMGGMKKYIEYCNIHNITKQYLEETIGASVPDVIKEVNNFKNEISEIEL